MFCFTFVFSAEHLLINWPVFQLLIFFLLKFWQIFVIWERCWKAIDSLFVIRLAWENFKCVISPLLCVSFALHQDRNEMKIFGQHVSVEHGLIQILNECFLSSYNCLFLQMCMYHQSSSLRIPHFLCPEIEDKGLAQKLLPVLVLRL